MSQTAAAWLAQARADCLSGPEWPALDTPPARTAAVIGGGTMGADITQALLAAGMRTLADNLDQMAVYPTTLGIPALREAIASWAERRFNVPAGWLDPAREPNSCSR